MDREVGNVRMINMARDFTLNVCGSQQSRHLRGLSSFALSLFFFWPCGLQDLSSPTRD